MTKWMMNSRVPGTLSGRVAKHLRTSQYFLLVFLSFHHSLAQVNDDGVTIIEIEKNIQLKKEKEPTLSFFELGIGYGFGSIADYPASDEYSKKSLLLPLVIYRGDILKSDQEDGTRAELFKSTNVEINLSFGARFNNDSDGNKARLGMPDLNYLIETGPAINYRIWKMPKVGSLTFQIPLRLTFETDFKRTDFLGFVFEPEIKFQKLNFIIPRLTSTTSFGVEFFNERVSNYYYQVEDQYVTADRSRYDGKSGLSALSIGQSFLYEFNQYNFILGVSYNDYSKAANRESSLFKSQQNTSVFAAVAWFFYQKFEPN